MFKKSKFMFLLASILLFISCSSEAMKIRTLRELITRLQPNVEPFFKLTVDYDFQELLRGRDEDDITLSALRKQSSSIFLNVYGALYSLQNDRYLMDNPALIRELIDVLAQIKKEFPDINTRYGFENPETYVDPLAHVGTPISPDVLPDDPELTNEPTYREEEATQETDPPQRPSQL